MRHERGGGGGENKRGGDVAHLLFMAKPFFPVGRGVGAAGGQEGRWCS